jgi:hypothetical protein
VLMPLEVTANLDATFLAVVLGSVMGWLANNRQLFANRPKSYFRSEEPVVKSGLPRISPAGATSFRRE